MDHHDRVFRYSKTWIRRFAGFFCLVPLGIGVVLIAFYLGRGDTDLLSTSDIGALMPWLWLLLLMFVFPVPLWWYVARMLANAVGRVEDGRFVVKLKREDLINVNLESVSATAIKKDLAGNVLSVVLRGPEGKKEVCGFEEMNSLAQEILSSLPESCRVTTSVIRSRLRMPSPPVVPAVLMVWLSIPLAFLAGLHLSIWSILYFFAVLTLLVWVAVVVWEWRTRGRFPARHALYGAGALIFLLVHIALFSFLESQLARFGISFW